MPRRSSTERFREIAAILPYLRRGATLSVAQLAESIGTSPEDIRADIYTLTMIGVPPYSPDALVDVVFDDDETTVSVYSDPPALERSVRLTGPEVRALSAALQSCGVGPDDPLMRRLGDAVGVDVDPTEVAHVVRAAVAPEGVGAVYATIARAVSACEKVCIEYFSAGRGETTTRVVRPYVMEYHRGSWFLSAFCELADADRVFRLDRVNVADPTGETFEPPAAPPAPTPDLVGRTGLTIAEIVFAAGAREPDAREWPGIETSPRDDGSVLARVPFDSPEWLARRVVARLGDATVTGPEELRAAVAQLTTRIAADHTRSEE
jgi:proteasome accessory factor C